MGFNVNSHWEWKKKKKIEIARDGCTHICMSRIDEKLLNSYGECVVYKTHTKYLKQFI